MGDPPVTSLMPDRICLADDQRSLRLNFGRHREPIETASVPGVIDVGEGGRLLSIEVETEPGHEPILIDVDPAIGDLSRTAAVIVTIGRDRDGSLDTITLPRRGAGYEITYPSGNQ